MKHLLMAGLLMAAMAGSVYAGRKGGYGSGNSGYGSNSNSTYVDPYTRKDGTQVEGHYRTKPNNTESDNYGTRGNYNPSTGKTGTKAPKNWWE